MHHHISATSAIVHALEIIVILGLLNMLAMKYQNKSNLAATWGNLFGVS